MNKRFKITITEVAFEECPAGREWKETGEDNPKFAYTPEIMKMERVEREIYHQDVEDLDLAQVIKAVNLLV